MSHVGTITRWIALLKAGDEAAAQRIWEAYFQKLIDLARRKLRGTPRRMADEEDVVLSAFDSFCRQVARGRFPRLDDRDDLWQLLVVLTARKAYALRRYELRAKRGGGKVFVEADLPRDDTPGEEAGLEQVIGREPTPAFAAQVAEECQRLLARLPNDELRSIAVWKMEGYTNEEIAAKLGYDSRTVRRRLKEIQHHWSQGTDGGSNADDGERSMKIDLAVTEGPHQGRVYSFSGHDLFIVGRSKRAHFQLDGKDRYFSRIHFMVELNPPQCRLVDMKSRNGTYVNGKKVTTADLRDGDLIKGGRTILRVAIEQGEPSASLPPPPPAPQVRSNVPEPDFKPLDTIKPFSSLQLPSVARKPEHVAAGSSGKPCLACEQPFEAGESKVSQWPLSLLCSGCGEQARQLPPPLGGYTLIRELGKGGMGVVYLAVREKDAALVALKTIIPTGKPTKRDIARFLREANILRELVHPNIVAFRDSGEANGNLFFAMDYVRGTDAARLLDRQRPLPVKRAVGLVCQVLSALEYAHARGFVHRDIKPANILIAEVDGKEVDQLADFGLARTYQASKVSGLTVFREIGGTVAYMPPEQIEHFRAVKPPSDQYAAAATLYHLLTGRLVYDFPSSTHGQLLMILQDEPVSIRLRRPELPEDLATMLHRALARDPEDRFADVEEMRQALVEFC